MAMEINKNDFEINIDNINVEEIMQMIRKRIEERGYTEEETIKNFDFSPNEQENDFEYEFNQMHILTDINLEKNIPLTPGIFSKLKLFLKKLVRKLVRPYVKPILEEQVNLNTHIVRVVDSLVKKNRELEQKLNTIQIELYEMKKSEEFTIDYLAFENKYRGSEENIQELQSQYLRLFEGKDNILDIGCGRGEFLKILLNSGKQQVLGLDLNSQMVEKCQKDNLPVKLYDGIKYLEENENLNLGGIFSSQVIEHLKPSQIIRFIKGAYNNIQDGGLLLMETINPMCLVAHTMSYPLDLSHRQMVHPFTIEMLLKEHGFKKVEFIYSSPNDTEHPILKTENMNENELNEYNEKIRRMHEILFGYQDYAVIAWK
jgi:methionine biosynthesis protein metW